MLNNKDGFAYGQCYRCNQGIRYPGNNYGCSSGAWVLNGTVADAVAQFNFILGGKGIPEKYKKEAHKEARAYGLLVDKKGTKYSAKLGTESMLLRDVEYDATQRRLLELLCTSKKTERQ